MHGCITQCYKAISRGKVYVTKPCQEIKKKSSCYIAIYTFRKVYELVHKLGFPHLIKSFDSRCTEVSACKTCKSCWNHLPSQGFYQSG